MKKIDLDQEWQVKGYWPYVPIQKKSMELGQELKGITDFIPAVVPGGVHFDLWKNGIIENPYYGMNSLKCEWIEHRWWMYRTTFEKPEITDEQTIRLVFEGLDYEVMIFLNDTLLGEHKGMYTTFSCDITDLIRDKNNLFLVFKGIPDEMGQIGYTSKTFTQKSRFNYKWDFGTRLVNIGIWEKPYLLIEEAVHLTDIYVYTDVVEEQGIIHVEGSLDRNEEVMIRVLDPDGELVKDQFLHVTGKEHAFETQLFIECAQLWYPNGYGDHPLYTVCVYAKEEKLLYSGKTGIRSLKLCGNEHAPEDALPYTFVVNDRKIYVKGVNMVPLDHLYGNVTRSQYSYLIEAAVNANVNFIRIWGGGLIEKEDFYELCDEAGIMLWQEFIQSSSGIDNKPCEDPAFLELLKENATAALRKKRNHVCLSAWSGGNELQEDGNIPCSYKNKNISMLKQLVETYDRTRMFYPTSASGPCEFVSDQKGISQDVHGGWQYDGNPTHYIKYQNADYLFHSEFGADAAISYKSMKKFLDQKDHYPTPMSGNKTWSHHGAWWGTYLRDVEIFGDITDIEEFIKCSQYMQVEALRFVIEADRRRAFRSSGCIVWQLNEPWPNASCTNLIDYYGETKAAYYWLKRTYEPLHLSMVYENLAVETGTKRALPVYIHNSGDATHVHVTVRVFRLNGECLYTEKLEATAKAGQATLAGEIGGTWEDQETYYIKLSVDENPEISNVYILGNKKNSNVLQGIRHLDHNVETEVLLTTEDKAGVIQKTVKLMNKGNEAAIHVGLELEQDDYCMLADDNYLCLLPGEEKVIHTRAIPRQSGSFLSEYNHDANSGHDLVFHTTCL